MRHVKGLNNCQHTERFIETFSLSLSLARNLNLIPVVEDLQEGFQSGEHRDLHLTASVRAET